MLVDNHSIQKLTQDSQPPTGSNLRDDCSPPYINGGCWSNEYDDLKTLHDQEFFESGISPATIALNYCSFADEYEASDALTYKLTSRERLNGGRLRNRDLKRLDHLKHGSWGCFGVDVLTGEESVWGRIKPDVPRSSVVEKDGIKKIKAIKYESPWNSRDRTLPHRQHPSKLTAIKVSLDQWDKVSQRYGVSMPENITVEGMWARGFYEWVRNNPSIPIGIAEGEKKGSCLIEYGHVLLGLPGMWMGRHQPKDEHKQKCGDPYLTPQMAYFAQPGREFYFTFDNDEKESTRKSVDKAVYATGDLLAAEGCHVSVVTWDGEKEKGLDDLLVAHGYERVAEAYDNRTPLDAYKLARYLASEEKQYQKNKLFTPNLEVDQTYLDVDMSGSNKAYFIKSHLGSGKTHNLIEQLLQEPERKVIYANYRNTLCLQFDERAKELGFYHYQTDKNREDFNVARRELKVSLCVDSVGNFDPSFFDGMILILDEVASTLKHALFSATIRDFENVAHLITEMMRRADRIIALDANLQDWVVNLISSLCPTKDIVTIGNIYKAKKADVIMLDGVIKDEKVQKNNRSPHIQSAIESNRPVFASDSQVLCESMETIYLEQGRKGIRIDSTTTHLPAVKAFLANPKEWIDKHKPDYVIYSPSAESGLDINVQGYFTELFGFFFGALDINSILQMLGRLRDPAVPQYVWCKEYIYSATSDTRPSNLAAVAEKRMSSMLSEIGELISASLIDGQDIVTHLAEIHKAYDNPYATAADTITAIRNHEFKNYRSCLAAALTEAGHKLTFYRPNYNDDFDWYSKAEKEAKAGTKLQKSADIYEASDKYIGETRPTIAYDAPPSEKMAVAKATLVNKMPGIQQSPVWSPAFVHTVIFEQPKLIQQLNNNYLLHHPDMANKIALARQNRIHNSDCYPIWKVKAELPYFAVIRDTGLLSLIESRLENPELPIDPESPEVKQIMAKCHDPKNKSRLGLVGKHPIKFLRRELKFNGYEMYSRKVKRDGVTVRDYYLDVNYLSSPIRSAIAESIKVKYEQKINPQPDLLEWDVYQPGEGGKAENKDSGKESAVSTATKVKTEVAHEGVIVNNTSAMCHHRDRLDSAGNNQSDDFDSTVIQDPLDTEAAISDLAEMLSLIETKEELAALSNLGKGDRSSGAFSRARLNRAVRRLSSTVQQKIKNWAIDNLNLSVNRNSNA